MSNDINDLFVIACENNDVIEARRLVATETINVNYINEFDWTALMLACANGHIDIARMLLQEFGADVNLRDNHGSTALMYACDYCHIEIARMLIQEFGADVNLKDQAGDTALIYACFSGHVSVARMLIQEFGADVNLTNNDGKTALDECNESCKAEYEAIITELFNSVIPVPPQPHPASNPALDSREASDLAEQQSSIDYRFETLQAERDSLEEELNRVRAQLGVISEERDRAVEELTRISTERDLRSHDDLPPFRLDKRYLLRHPCNGVAGTLHRCMDGSPLFEYAQRLWRTGGSMYPRQQAVQEFRLVAVDEVVPYHHQVAAFEARLETMELLRGTCGSHFNFATNQFVSEKLAVLTTIRDAFHERTAGEPPRRVNTLYCFHGPRPEHVESICRAGLVDVRAMDAGFFGSGCYTTLNIEYAARYAVGDFDKTGQRRAPPADGRYPVVMFAAAVGMAYPITPAEDYGHVAGIPDGHSDYFGRPLRPGFDLHCVCVSEGAGMQAVTRNYCQYIELVMSQQSDLLPIAVLWLERI